MANSIAGGEVFQRLRLQSPEGPLHQGSATQDARSIKFFQDRPLPCPKHVGATATIFVAAQPPEPLPERTTDGCCFYHFKTSFKPDGSVGAGGGSADPARTSTEGAAPTTPPGGVIDRMRQLEHSRVSRAAPRAGPAMVARKCGPAGPNRGRGPAWADNESSWAVPSEDVLVDPADEPDVIYRD